MTEQTARQPRFRITIATLLFVTLCVAGFLGGFRAGHSWGFARGVRQFNSERLYTVTYSVADLLLSRATDRGTATADYDSLIETVKSTVDPTSWDDVGGYGSIAPFEVNLSLIVSQTEQGHNSIAALLKQLRKSSAQKLQQAPQAISSEGSK